MKKVRIVDKMEQECTQQRGKSMKATNLLLMFWSKNKVDKYGTKFNKML